MNVTKTVKTLTFILSIIVFTCTHVLANTVEKNIHDPVFTLNVLNNNPTDNIKVLKNNINQIYFFARTQNMEGQPLTFVWEVNGIIVNRDIQFLNRNDQSVKSLQLLDASQTGTWTVTLLSWAGKELSTNSFKYKEYSRQKKIETPSHSETEFKIGRSQFTSLILDNEPTDAIRILTNSTQKLFFVSYQNGPQTEILYHQWRYKNDIVFTKKFEAQENNNKLVSSIILKPQELGKWSVEVLNSVNLILSKKDLLYVDQDKWPKQTALWREKNGNASIITSPAKIQTSKITPPPAKKVIKNSPAPKSSAPNIPKKQKTPKKLKFSYPNKSINVHHYAIITSGHDEREGAKETHVWVGDKYSRIEIDIKTNHRITLLLSDKRMIKYAHDSRLVTQTDSELKDTQNLINIAELQLYLEREKLFTFKKESEENGSMLNIYQFKQSPSPLKYLAFPGQKEIKEKNHTEIWFDQLTNLPSKIQTIVDGKVATVGWYVNFGIVEAEPDFFKIPIQHQFVSKKSFARKTQY